MVHIQYDKQKEAVLCFVLLVRSEMVISLEVLLLLRIVFAILGFLLVKMYLEIALLTL